MKKKTLFTIFAALATTCIISCKHANKSTSAAVPDKSAMSTIMNRKSVRNYTNDTLPAGMMETLLRAAMAAPTGMDIRPWRFVVLTDKTQYDSIFGDNFNLDMYKRAAAVIVFCADTTVTRPPHDNPDAAPVTAPNQIWRDDMGACVENFLLAAEANGLGACWTACYPFAERMTPIRTALSLPAQVVPYAVVPIGYPTGDNKVKDKWKADNIHYGKW